MKKIVITGATGLVGFNLLSIIDGDKYNIIAIDKNKNNLKLGKKLFPKVNFVHADLSEIDDSWIDLIKESDCVISLHAQISSPQKDPYIKNNVGATKNLIKVCEKNKVNNFIYFSSSVVISVADDHYTNTKRDGENLVKNSNLNYTILRPPLMYGCFDVKHLGFMAKLMDVSPIFPVPGSGKYMRQPLYVLDICKIVLKIIELEPENKIYNIIGKEKINFIDLLKIIAQERKMKRLFFKIPIPVFLFLLKIFGLLTSKKPFVPEQLTALMAGDDFPLSNWEETFKIKYTPFREAIKETINSEYYPYRKKMIKTK
ncbi:NAD-dependent epimerase/dehydratase family protein [archaeon]|nr:NAD-dependent epimerase/dehydratase family protein [archaeon]MBT6869304.1 NAD-dependent epimerase/dehydratase family protein [archaeon]MBT7192467.1 NAD-dependent epimerase/dehydratase family protein [archaeon]MBT7380543.1 NAD-dependent epimerase/dehydratase family protein [archaeon]MBT7507781.1 NAD-dependent epimerase/dehydratase family protein [archaeon]